TMGKPRRIRVLVNPSAHSGRARAALERVRRQEVRQEDRLEWVESTNAAHLGELVRAAQEEELDAVALAGGDGTVALAVGALGEKNRVPPALWPAGSGNDFARHLGIPQRLPDALAMLSSGIPRLVDVARAEPGGRRFCCVASIGF